MGVSLPDEGDHCHISKSCEGHGDGSDLPLQLLPKEKNCANSKNIENCTSKRSISFIIAFIIKREPSKYHYYKMGGGLIQLISVGASDRYMDHCDLGLPYNFSDLANTFDVSEPSGRGQQNSYFKNKHLDHNMGNQTSNSPYHIPIRLFDQNVLLNKMARRIQHQWRESITNPAYRMCRSWPLQSPLDRTDLGLIQNSQQQQELNGYRRQAWSPENQSIFAHFPNVLSPNLKTLQSQKVRQIPGLLIRRDDNYYEIKHFKPKYHSDPHVSVENMMGFRADQPLAIASKFKRVFR